MTFRQIMLCTAVLIPLSLGPALFGMAGKAYVVSALLLGLGFLYFAYRASQHRSKGCARQLLHVSVIYLPIVYAVMVIDRGAW